MPLPGGCVEPVGILRIHDHIGHTCPFIASKHFFPAYSPVCGFVQSPLTALAPERTLGCHEYHLRTAGVHNDLRDMLRLLQTHVLPALPSVIAAVDPVAVSHVTATNIFTRSYPDRVRVGRIDGHTPDGIGAFLIKNRCPGGPCIVCFPDTARTHGHIPAVVVFRMHRNICNPARLHGGTHIPELQPLEGSGGK